MAEKNFFQIFTLGCKVNGYDSSVIARRLQLLDWELTSKKDLADLFLINTCSVTKEALRKDRRLFNSIKKYKPSAKIILFGCGVKLYRDQFERLGADYLFEVNQANQIIEQIRKIFPEKRCQKKTDEENELDFIQPPKAGEKARYFLKIQDGCEQFCSYCIIPYSRGNLWSRSIDEILQEAHAAIINGYREIVLCGVHLGLYGKEKDSQCGARDLAQVIEKLSVIDGLERLRLSSIEVNDIDQRVFEQFHRNPKLCHHLHLSLQSGSDNVLERMNRPYNKAYFADICRELKKIDSNFSITTDVIVGFPGESEEDFQATLSFVREVGFSRLHVFPFSAHEKTPAFQMEPKVELQVIKNRAEKLRKAGAELVKEFDKKLKDQTHRVLVEYYFTDRGLYKGKTQYFNDLFFAIDQVIGRKDEIKIGEIVEVKERQANHQWKDGLGNGRKRLN